MHSPLQHLHWGASSHNLSDYTETNSLLVCSLLSIYWVFPRHTNWTGWHQSSLLHSSSTSILLFLTEDTQIYFSCPYLLLVHLAGKTAASDISSSKPCWVTRRNYKPANIPVFLSLYSPGMHLRWTAKVRNLSKCGPVLGGKAKGKENPLCHLRGLLVRAVTQAISNFTLWRQMWMLSCTP